MGGPWGRPPGPLRRGGGQGSPLWSSEASIWPGGGAVCAENPEEAQRTFIFDLLPSPVPGASSRSYQANSTGSDIWLFAVGFVSEKSCFGFLGNPFFAKDTGTVPASFALKGVFKNTKLDFSDTNPTAKQLSDPPTASAISKEVPRHQFSISCLATR